MNVSQSVPKLLTLKAVSKEVGLPEYTVRRLYREGHIVGIRTGKKILINLEKFVEFINTQREEKDYES